MYDNDNYFTAVNNYFSAVIISCALLFLLKTTYYAAQQQIQLKLSKGIIAEYVFYDTHFVIKISKSY